MESIFVLVFVWIFVDIMACVFENWGITLGDVVSFEVIPSIYRLLCCTGEL